MWVFFHSCNSLTKCYWVFSSDMTCAQAQAICQFLGHMFIPEFIWENSSLIRHGIAHVWSGSHHFYPAVDSSLHTQFPVTTISSDNKGPEIVFVSPNEHEGLLEFSIKWTMEVLFESIQCRI